MKGLHRSMAKGLAAAAPALALGLAGGLTAGVLAAGALDTTPYAETDFNTAKRDAYEAGQAAGETQANRAAAQVTAEIETANADRVAALKERLERLRGSLKQVAKESAKRAEEVTRLEGSLAEKTAALQNAASLGGRSVKGGHRVEGSLRTTWTLGPGARPWPQACSQPLNTYEVRVTSGDGATVADAPLVGGEVVRRKERGRSLTLVCSLTYAANLPTPLGSDYEFVAVLGASPDTRRDGKAAPAAALEDGSGPTLSVTR